MSNPHLCLRLPYTELSIILVLKLNSKIALRMIEIDLHLVSFKCRLRSRGEKMRHPQNVFEFEPIPLLELLALLSFLVCVCDPAFGMNLVAIVNKPCL
jgi:hypothetical protein